MSKDSDPGKSENEKLEERVTRWQETTMEQLGYSINLILSFSVASLGFQLLFLQSDKFTSESSSKCIFNLSLIMLCISILFGILVVVNRLRDFRLTTKIARQNKELNDEGKLKDQRTQILAIDRDHAKKIGECTWILFGWQIGTFGVGILFTVISVVITYGEKLF